jgi:predicted nucleic acid-binding protein
MESRGFTFKDELEIATRHDLTVYDAMYLALARRHKIPLLTRDRALQQAATKEKVLP